MTTARRVVVVVVVFVSGNEEHRHRLVRSRRSRTAAPCASAKSREGTGRSRRRAGAGSARRARPRRRATTTTTTFRSGSSGSARVVRLFWPRPRLLASLRPAPSLGHARDCWRVVVFAHSGVTSLCLMAPASACARARRALHSRRRRRRRRVVQRRRSLLKACVAPGPPARRTRTPTSSLHHREYFGPRDSITIPKRPARARAREAKLSHSSPFVPCSRQRRRRRRRWGARRPSPHPRQCAPSFARVRGRWRRARELRA